MPKLPLTPNALWWVQVHLLGGAVKLMAFDAAYLALLIGAAVGFRYVDRTLPIAVYCDAAITVLTVIQMVLIIPGGCTAVFRALTRDMNTRMFESHRLSPMGSTSVVVGYVFGANVQLLQLYIIGVAVGTVIIRWGTVGVAQWLAGNLYMLCLAPMIWTVTLLVGLGRKKPVNPGTILFLLFVSTPAIMASPGIGLLSGMFAGRIGSYMMTGATLVRAPVAIGMLLVGIGMTVIWVRAAMRRFRRPDLPAFGVYRGLGMLVIWLAANIFCPLIFDMSTLRALGTASAEIGVRFAQTVLTVTATGAMMIAVLPLSAAAHAACGRSRGHKPPLTGPGARANHLPMLCAALVMAFTVPTVATSPWETIIVAGVAVWGALVAIEGLLRIAYSRRRRATILVILYIVVFWGAAPLADLWLGEVRAARSMLDVEPDRTALFGLSPVGSLAKLYFGLVFDARGGLLVQLGVSGIVWYVGRRSPLRPRTSDPSKKNAASLSE